ncbi:MAG: ATP-binding cassette domain-containing protein [Bacteriovoracaceae bacterium]|nr:ATP-binding cassette domain-containing protein [Bacteriovoracaceae bacterium]
MFELNPFTFSYRDTDSSKKLFLKTKIVLAQGEIVAIVGPSGAGKSTLLKILKGIIPEHSTGKLDGEILYNGKNLTGINFDLNLRLILYLFQNPFSQLLHPTTEEEFLFSLENFNYSVEEIKKRGEKLEKVFNLPPLWGKKTKDLSNGECQKLVLASLMAVDPEVLLLDEPTAFLDPLARIEFYNFLGSIKGQHLVIIVDHHLEEIRHLVTRYLFVDSNGEIKEVIKEEHQALKSLEKKGRDKESITSNINLSLNVKNLSFSYDKKNPLLKEINLRIYGGEVIAIKGSNGAGKSTLFKLLSGMLRPSQGIVELEINKKIIKHSKLFEVVGFVFQNPEAHFFFDTIEQELKQSFKKNRPTEDTLKSFFNNIDLSTSPFLLSEGEKRRLSILMTVFLGKKVILFDEPTFGQDEKSRMVIANLIRELKTQGIIQIMISHDDSFIEEVADRVYHLEQGNLNVVS